MVNQSSPRTGSPPLEITCSRNCLSWLSEQQISLAFTTYQTNRLFLIGLKSEGQLSIFERLFDRPMGLYATSERLYLSSRYQLWQLDNALLPGQRYNGYDKLYIPRLAHTTGDLDIHDVAVEESGRIVFANTLYSCLATTSDRYSFTPLWHPPFIEKLAPEDRCHLNGIALVDGQPGYATAISRSDVAAGWREKRQSGGCLIDVRTNQLLLTDLSMPHSPRWYRDKLWLLNSGTGDFGYVDFARGCFNAIAFCPGYLRGLAFYKDWAIVGLSQTRRDRPSPEQAFSGLALDERLAAKEATSRCGLAIINLNTGNIDHWLYLDGIITELYDVQVLPQVKRPMALGFRTDEICHFITVDPQQSSISESRNEPFIQDAQKQGQIFPNLEGRF
ncbi:TIGR03032 family protein [Lusitaniella coriacea LEGE 07157]|uniref:TIGR03032 family protein n=1 Tax=Lusitaniella coriacea LEGE 07157 TaxID=945747 RepID=A0A8J7JDQ2_9CYAN|nr:TIGR03032 family protein [Lusitaniella coriacea]MBE9118405.1 TIGR03032 family protein [Lusitaniella coriacea LEGE 07157]